jgi:hypothetical protein
MAKSGSLPRRIRVKIPEGRVERHDREVMGTVEAKHTPKRAALILAF